MLPMFYKLLMHQLEMAILSGCMWTKSCDCIYIAMDSPTFLNCATLFFYHYPPEDIPKLADKIVKLGHHCRLLHAACKIWEDVSLLTCFSTEAAWNQAFQMHVLLFLVHCSALLIVIKSKKSPPRTQQITFNF